MTRRRWRGSLICRGSPTLSGGILYSTVELKGRITLTVVAVGDAHGRLSSQLHARALAVAMTPTPSEMQRIDLTGNGLRVKEISMTLTDKSIGGRVC